MKKETTSSKNAKSTKLKVKATPVASAPRTSGEDVDGCDVIVTNATLDHDLPPSRGGVA
jgi:hypothetical protein